jgi:starch-binding outer membrane protein, SusD/RagB family
MTCTLRSVRGIGVAAGLALGITACDLDVANPGIIDASAFDPTGDAVTLSLSSQQIFFSALQSVIQSGGLLSEELWTGAVRIEQNDISRRTLTLVNLDINTGVFAPLSRSFITNDDVVATLSAGPNANADVNLARASMAAGFSLVLLAEHMCEGVIRQSRALTVNEVLDSAIVRFQRAITVATAAGGTAGTAIVNASNVGLARAQLQKGDNNAASITAALVPSTMANYNVLVVDSLVNRALGNQVYGTSEGNTQSVPQKYQITDSRVPWVTVTTPPQDPTLGPLVRQRKYTSYGSPIRIASYLEARYILAEAELKKANPAPAAALIAERSAPTVTGVGATPLSATTPLGQLMELRAREFWLEGKHIGDIRRNPLDKAYYDAPDTFYYKGSSTRFGSAICFPIPNEEVNTNPNIP